MASVSISRSNGQGKHTFNLGLALIKNLPFLTLNILSAGREREASSKEAVFYDCA